MPVKSINIEGLGEVTFSANERSVRVRLSIKSDGEIYVSMPLSVSYDEALRFVKSKAEWIKKHQLKIRQQSTVFSPQSNFRTKFHQLVLTKSTTGKVYNRIGKGVIQIFIPEHVDFTHPRVQEFIRKTLVDVMRWEAKVYLPKRIEELADKYGFKYQNVSIKNASTRWGSCSSANNINLNLHLMRIPDHLTDYVLLHELTHTVVKNHSEKFWLLLDHCYPGARKADKEMNNYRTQTF